MLQYPASATTPMSPQPCRNRNRQQLLSSIYNNTPLFRRLITALDDGLNRHNPCTCPSCETQPKRSPSPHLETPPSKRARRRSPSPSPPSKPLIYYCRWCSFPDHFSRQTCRECGRRRAPSHMVQHFRVPRPSVVNSPYHSIPFNKPPADSFIHGTLTEQPDTPLTQDHTDPATSCDMTCSPNPLSSQSLQDVQPSSAPLPTYVSPQPVHSPMLQYHSPQSTPPDPTQFTDYESICSPAPGSMASKSMRPVEKNEYTIVNLHPTNTNDDDINVASLMEEVSKEVSEDANSLGAVDSPRFSLVSSAVSDITTESVVELGGVENEHCKSIDDHKSLPDEIPADMFLSEIILSDDEDNADTCEDISDLPLTFFDGVFSSVNEQDAC